MDVTVVVPSALQEAVEGRAQLTLGLPRSAGVAEVLEALFHLYPGLARHVTSERDPARTGFSLFFDERTNQELAHRRSGLRHGERIYLCATLPRRAGVV